MRLFRITPRQLALVAIAIAGFTLFSPVPDSGRPSELANDAIPTGAKDAPRVSATGTPEDSLKPNEIPKDDLNAATNAPTNVLNEPEWKPQPAPDLAIPVPLLIADPRWKPPPNETLPFLLPNGTERLVKCRAEYDAPCKAWPNLVEEGSLPLRKNFPAQTLQRFLINADGIYSAALFRFAADHGPEGDPTRAPEAIVPVHLIPDPEQANAAYVENDGSHITKWHAAFIVPDPGDYQLIIRLKQPTSQVTDPDVCTPLASYTPEEMSQVSAAVNFSDPNSGSPFVRQLRDKCGWDHTREHWFDVMKNDPGRPYNVPWVKSKVFQLELSVTDPLESSVGGPAIPRTNNSHLSPDLEKLFRFVYQPPSTFSSEAIAKDLRLFSLGSWITPSQAPLNSTRAVPGDPWIRPTQQLCPFVYERHAISANCSARQGSLVYQPLFARKRTDWLIPRDRLFRCIREERFKIVGDSLAGLFSSALGCTCLTYGGRCKWEVMDKRGQKGQIFPLGFFPPAPTGDEGLWRFLADAEWGAGAELWQMGAWPIAYSNSTTWLAGFQKMLEHMARDMERGKAEWIGWLEKREKHREGERKRIADEEAEIEDAKRRLAAGEKGVLLKTQKAQYLRSLDRPNFNLQSVPGVPRRYYLAAATPFQTKIEPLEYLRTPGFQTLGRAVKYNYLLLRSYNTHLQIGGKVGMLDTYRLLEHRFDARTDNAHYCPDANWEVAMVLWHGLCEEGGDL